MVPLMKTIGLLPLSPMVTVTGTPARVSICWLSLRSQEQVRVLTM